MGSDQGGVSGEDEGSGERGEREQAAEQYRARSDPVGQRPEHWLEDHNVSQSELSALWTGTSDSCLFRY
jgi:hypothetical protein